VSCLALQTFELTHQLPHNSSVPVAKSRLEQRRTHN
jgi:hypothetical protein